MERKVADLTLEKVEAGLALPRIMEFLDILRKEHNFMIGISEYINTQNLLDELSAKQKLPGNAADLIANLTPLLCKSSEQQGRIKTIYQSWIHQISEPQVAEPEKPILSQEIKTLQRRTTFWLWLIVVFIFLALGLYYGLPSPPPPISTGGVLLNVKDSTLAVNDTLLIQYKIQNESLDSLELRTSFPSDIIKYIGITQTDPEQFIIDSVIDQNRLIFIFYPKGNLGNAGNINFIANSPGSWNIIFEYRYLRAKGEYTNWISIKRLPSINIGYKPDSPVWAIILFSILIFIVLFIYSMWNISAFVFLKRRFPDLVEDFSFLKLPQPALPDNIDPRIVKRIANRLNRRVEQNNTVIDFNSTIAATAASAGLTQVRHTNEKSIPEYLVLIDKATSRDHQAIWVENWLSKLAKYGVRFEVLFFDRDIRSCFKPGINVAYEFSQLFQIFPDSILLLFSDAKGITNPSSRRLEKWAVDLFYSWNRKILFSPENLEKEHPKYQEFFRNDFLVFPLSEQGLVEYASTDLGIPAIPSIVHTIPHFLPSMLYDHSIQWMSRRPPDKETIFRLIDELRDKYLGVNGFSWLSACAVYPELNYGLTIYLGHKLLKEDNKTPIYNSILLTRLMQLPWFRQSYMPDWLRTVLIQEMDDFQAEQIRRLVYNWFFAALDAKERMGTLPVEIAITDEIPIGRLRNQMFKIITQRAAPKSKLKEYIFADFMQDPLSFKVPNMNSGNRNRFGTTLMHKILSAFQAYNIPMAVVKSGLIAGLAGLCLWAGERGLREIKNEYLLFSIIGVIAVIIFIALFRTIKYWSRLPKGMPYILGNEMAERFNFFGLRAILTTFMVQQFYNASGSADPAVVQAAEATANANTHNFVAMMYLLPMFGGMVADWFWGKYKTILYLSLVYSAGSIMVALSVNSEVMFTSSLMLIALGAGGIKPCVSANVGDQFRFSNMNLLSWGYAIFYGVINIGSVMSILLIPYLKATYGPKVAFGVPAIAMLVAVFFFWAGRHKYRRVPLPKNNLNKMVILATALGSLVVSYLYFDKTLHAGIGPVLGAWVIMVLALAFIFKKQWFARPGNFVGINLFALINGGFVAAAKEYGDEAIEDIKSVWRLLSVFAFIPVFWALWDQSQSEWVVQATKMDLDFLGITWQAEQISFVNAAFILAFIPLFSFVLYPMLEKMGIRVTPLRKIGTGFVLTALSFVVIAIIQGWIDAGERPNISWQIFAFVILTAGEVLISITGLEYAYTQAPPSMKSTIMACWLITVTLGNLIVSVIQNNIKDGGFFAQFHGADFFWLFVGICGITSILFMVITPRIKEKNYFL